MVSAISNESIFDCSKYLGLGLNLGLLDIS